MVTLDEVKAYLGITGTDDDVRLQAILDDVNDKVESCVGDLSIGEKTMTVKNTSVKNNTFTLNITNPTDVTNINGNDISSLTPGVDYLIKSDGEFIFDDILNLIRNDFGFFEVKFMAGFASSPKSLIGTVSNYVGYLFEQDNGKDVISYKAGPRSTLYSDDKTPQGSIALKKFKGGLNKYIPLAFRIY